MRGAGCKYPKKVIKGPKASNDELFAKLNNDGVNECRRRRSQHNFINIQKKVCSRCTLVVAEHRRISEGYVENSYGEHVKQTVDTMP